MSPPSGKTLLKSFEHSVAATDHLVAEFRIGLIQPRGQADAAGNGINFRDRVTFIGQNQIRPDNLWQIIPEFFLARELDQLRGFPGIEIARDPRRLFAFDAELIELIASALKNEEPMPELLQFLFERCDRSAKGSGEISQSFSAKSPSVGIGGSDGGEFVGIGALSKRRMSRRTSNASYSVQQCVLFSSIGPTPSSSAPASPVLPPF